MKNLSRVKVLWVILTICFISNAQSGSGEHNYLSNSSFDDAGTMDPMDNLTHWVKAFGSDPISWQNDADIAHGGTLQGGDNGENSGSVSTFDVTSCATGVTGGADTHIGLSYKVVSGNVSLACVIAVAETDATDCSPPSMGSFNYNTGVLEDIIPPHPPVPAPSSSWNSYEKFLTLGNNTQSLLTRLRCVNNQLDDSDFTVRFDDPFVEQRTVPVELQSFIID